MAADPKSRILARRAKFMAAALTTLGASAEGCSSAQACLEPAIRYDTGTTDAADAEPQACLSAPPEDTGHRDTANPAIADDAARDGTAEGG